MPNMVWSNTDATVAHFQGANGSKQKAKKIMQIVMFALVYFNLRSYR